MRCAVGPQRDHFAVHDRLVDGQHAHRRDDLGDGGRHVPKVAREHPDLVAALVDLDAGAIQLPFERGLILQLCESRIDVVGRLRQHRLHRLEDLNAEPGEAVFAADQGRPGHRSERASHHDGSSYGGARDVRGLCHGINQHGFERALPQLARQQTDDEVLFGAGGSPKERAELFEARRRCAGSLYRSDVREGVIEIDQVQAGRFGRRRVLRCPERRVSDPDASLTRLAGQQANRRFYLVWGETAKQIRRARRSSRACCFPGPPPYSFEPALPAASRVFKIRRRGARDEIAGLSHGAHIVPSDRTPRLCIVSTHARSLSVRSPSVETLARHLPASLPPTVLRLTPERKGGVHGRLCRYGRYTRPRCQRHRSWLPRRR